MSKRGCSSSSSDLSGGTGDINPQVIAVHQTYSIPNSAAATGVVMSIPNPAWDLNRAAGAGACPKAKAFVMEILKIWLLTDSPAIGANATVPLYGLSGVSVVAVNAPPTALLTTSGVGACMEWLQQQNAGPAAAVPTATCLAVSNVQTHFTNGTFTGAPPIQDLQPNRELWHETDLTDEAGHGVIIGTQQLQILAFTFYNQVPGVTQTNMMGARILYRFKGVPYDEFIRQYTFGY